MGGSGDRSDPLSGPYPPQEESCVGITHVFENLDTRRALNKCLFLSDPCPELICFSFSPGWGRTKIQESSQKLHESRGKHFWGARGTHIACAREE